MKNYICLLGIPVNSGKKQSAAFIKWWSTIIVWFLIKNHVLISLISFPPHGWFAHVPRSVLRCNSECEHLHWIQIVLLMLKKELLKSSYTTGFTVQLIWDLGRKRRMEKMKAWEKSSVLLVRHLGGVFPVPQMCQTCHSPDYRKTFV